MASSSLFANFGRAAKVLALLLFFLPWVTVSCSTEALERIQSEAAQRTSQPSLRGPGLGAGVPIADASGLNMALGQVRMMMPDMGASERSGGPTASQPPAVAVEIGVIAGAALLLLALVAGFLLKGRSVALVGLGGSILAMAAFCYSMFISYPPAVRAAFATRNPSGAGAENMPTSEQLAEILSVKPATGFWLVMLALALAILFNALALRKPVAATGTPPPAV